MKEGRESEGEGEEEGEGGREKKKGLCYLGHVKMQEQWGNSTASVLASMAVLFQALWKLLSM